VLNLDSRARENHTWAFSRRGKGRAAWSSLFIRQGKED